MFHVLLRTASLLLLGFFMVNGERHPQPTGWPKGLWNLLIYTFGILAFLSVPKSSTRARSVMWLMRGIAFAGLIFLAIVFRAPDGDGMRPAWWGILGLIGWAYLVASVFYLVFRNNRPFLVAVTALLIGLFIFDHTGAFDGFWLRSYINFGEMLGSHAAIAAAGVVLGTIILDA